MNPSQYVVNAMQEPNDDNFVGLDEFEDIILSSQSLFPTQQDYQEGDSNAIRFNFQELNADGSVDSSQRLQQQSLELKTTSCDILDDYQTSTMLHFRIVAYDFEFC